MGTIAEPNLEAIAALQPELILPNKARHEDPYPRLAQIAPTVFAERVGAVWKGNFALPTGEVATFAELSAEELTVADADVVLHSSYGPAADSGAAAVLGGPLWPRLGAVQAGRAYAVEDDVFFTDIGLTAARLIVARLGEPVAA